MIKAYYKLISLVLAAILWVVFAVYEYDGGVYADAHGTSGSIVSGWSVPLFLAALLFTILGYKDSSKRPKTQ